jgi:hypothetical protein
VTEALTSISELEARAAASLGLDPGSFARSQLTVDGAIVAVGTAVDSGGVEVVASHRVGDETHSFHAARTTCCFGVSGAFTVEVDPGSVSPHSGPVVAKMLAFALDQQPLATRVLVPEWDAMIKEREDFAALGLICAHWNVELERSRFARAWLSPVPRTRGAPTIAQAFYESRLRRCAARYERLRALDGPAVILQNEREMIRGNVEQLRRRGHWDAVACSLPEALLATVRDALDDAK